MQEECVSSRECDRFDKLLLRERERIVSRFYSEHHASEVLWITRSYSRKDSDDWDGQLMITCYRLRQIQKLSYTNLRCNILLACSLPSSMTNTFTILSRHLLKWSSLTIRRDAAARSVLNVLPHWSSYELNNFSLLVRVWLITAI